MNEHFCVDNKFHTEELQVTAGLDERIVSHVCTIFMFFKPNPSHVMLLVACNEIEDMSSMSSIAHM